VRGCEFIRISAIEIAAPKALSLTTIEMPLEEFDTIRINTIQHEDIQP
jgi:hypothetical protein